MTPLDKVDNEEVTWLATLTSDQESLLIHSDTMINLYSPDVSLHDLPRAAPSIQWQDITIRLRNVHDIPRLFQGYDDVRAKYKSYQNTVTPIGLLAVSLNNAAVCKNSPFKFC